MESNDLDLHGVFHSEAKEIVLNHIFLNTPPFKIITGNSTPMQQIVIEALEENKYKYIVGDWYNMGYVTVIGE